MSKAQITSSVTRIASRLSKKGIKGVTEQIREAIAKIENYQATKEQETMIVEQFLFADEPTESNLTMIESITEAIEPVIDESVVFDTPTPEVTTELATVSEGNTTEPTETLAASEVEKTQKTDSSIVYQPKDVFEKSKIVKQQADSMAMVLNPVKCLEIASLIDDNHATELDFLTVVGDLLIAQIELKNSAEANLLNSQLNRAKELRQHHGDSQLLKIAQTSHELDNYNKALRLKMAELLGVTEDGKRLKNVQR